MKKSDVLETTAPHPTTKKTTMMVVTLNEISEVINMSQRLTSLWSYLEANGTFFDKVGVFFRFGFGFIFSLFEFVPAEIGSRSDNQIGSTGFACGPTQELC